MTSLPVFARPRLQFRPRAPIPALFNPPRAHPSRENTAPGFLETGPLGLRRTTDTADRSRRAARPTPLVQPVALILPVLLFLLTAVFLTDAFGMRAAAGFQIHLWLHGGALAGLLVLWSQLRQLNASHLRNSGLARSDELTGLPNRRALNERLQALLSGRDQHEPPQRGRPQNQKAWSVLLIDVDHFKAANDMYGHLAGDEILKALASSLTQELRSEDMLGRWGGEEFLALLPATSFEGALVAAERLRRAISRRTFPYAGSVTVSIGVASCLPGDTLERVVARADTGMYTAKRTGRNRVAFTE